MSKTIEKGFQLLDLFTEEKPFWRLDEISAYSQIPKPTVHRLLKTFVDHGFLQRSEIEKNGLLVEGDTYSLGLKLMYLGSIVSSNLEIRNISLPHMKILQSKFNEAVQLVSRDKDEGVYIEKVESTRPVRLYTKTGRRAPLYAGACTRILLSFLSDDEISDILKQPLTFYASQTPQRVEDVWSFIHETRKSGFAYSVSELEEGTVSIAAPIFNRLNEVEFSISIAGFSTSLPREKVNDFLVPLWEAAEIISQKIGYTNPYPYGLSNIEKH
ncbi:IclR family transcriptional regulator [Bacillus sp. FJAT-22090]|uniref:IclR family transcriptional regulator n=1 Tax=Bacillus sp. FJAT-22090 TaxID=1581038 RepID=UPI0011A2BB9C|nr:IclR family transcriptional regulator [Bacillus sp. FJAT-22090]